MNLIITNNIVSLTCGYILRNEKMLRNEVLYCCTPLNHETVDNIEHNYFVSRSPFIKNCYYGFLPFPC